MGTYIHTYIYTHIMFLYIDIKHVCACSACVIDILLEHETGDSSIQETHTDTEDANKSGNDADECEDSNVGERKTQRERGNVGQKTYQIEMLSNVKYQQAAGGCFE